MTRLGLMLYSVRAECARDLEGTLGAVAELGYEGVELFDLHGHEPERVREWLDEHRLVACGRHAGFDVIEASLPELAREAAALGTDRLVLSWIEPPDSGEAAAAVVERLLASARRADELGLRLGFHNHAGEVRPLDDGKSFVERLLDTAPELLFLELDLGWIWFGGADPVELLGLAAGRCPLVHVKDFRTRDEVSFCPVGDGAVGYERVFPAAVSAGVEWLLVEQDECEGPALDAARRSYAAVRLMTGAPA